MLKTGEKIKKKNPSSTAQPEMWLWHYVDNSACRYVPDRHRHITANPLASIVDWLSFVLRCNCRCLALVILNKCLESDSLSKSTTMHRVPFSSFVHYELLLNNYSNFFQSHISFQEKLANLQKSGWVLVFYWPQDKESVFVFYWKT